MCQSRHARTCLPVSDAWSSSPALQVLLERCPGCSGVSTIGPLAGTLSLFGDYLSLPASLSGVRALFFASLLDLNAVNAVIIKHNQFTALNPKASSACVHKGMTFAKR